MAESEFVAGEGYYFAKANQYLTIHLDSAYLFANQALSAAIEHNNEALQAESYNVLGKVAYFREDWESAEAFFAKGIETTHVDTTEYKLLVNCALTQKQLQKHEEAVINLNKAIEYTVNDSVEHAFVFKQLGNLYTTAYQYQKAIENYKKALLFADKSDKKEQISLYNNTGYAYYESKQFTRAVVAYQKAYRLSSEMRDTLQMTNCLINIGLAFQSASQYEQAIGLHRKALELARQNNYQEGVAYALSHIAQVFSDWKQYNEAIENFQAALTIYHHQRKKLCYARTLANLASVYKQQQNYAKALEMYQQVLEMQNAFNEDESKVATTLTNIGETYQLLNKNGLAAEYFNRALEVYNSTTNNYGQARLLYYTAKEDMRNGNYNEAEQKLLKSLMLTQKTDEKQLLKALFFTFAQLYKQQQKWQEAVLFHERYVHLKDSLFSLETHKQLAGLQALYETEKKQRQIDSLWAAQQLQQSELKRQKRLRTSYLTGFVVVLILSVLLSMEFLKKNRAYKVLVQKNNELLKVQQPAKAMAIKTLHTGNELPPPAYDKPNETATENHIIEELEELMQEEKLFLDKDLNLNKVAKKLDTNRTYLSEEIKGNFNCNFSDYVKKYRIEEAMLHLADAQNEYLTIEAIAGQVGFNSKSTFNTAFKKITGLTPSYYREQTLAGKKV